MNPNETLPAAAPSSLLPLDLYVDAEGTWFYQGCLIIREDILELFYQNLTLAEDGRTFAIDWQGQRYRLNVADTPYVVVRVDRREDHGAVSFWLTLKHHPTAEVLDPASLAVGAGNVLYCRVRSGRFPARFSRPAYYQMAQWIEQDREDGPFFVECNGTRYPIGEVREGV